MPRVTEAECVRIAAKEYIQDVPGRANLGRHENPAGDTRGANMVRVWDKQVRVRGKHGKSSHELISCNLAKQEQFHNFMVTGWSSSKRKLCSQTYVDGITSKTTTNFKCQNPTERKTQYILTAYYSKLFRGQSGQWRSRGHTFLFTSTRRAAWWADTVGLPMLCIINQCI